ncbi:hypothetical protein POK33_39245 [Burkholderia cenocepacia]|nr:hypothetical protein [Burkholderia cenocepacia]
MTGRAAASLKDRRRGIFDSAVCIDIACYFFACENKTLRGVIKI